jgi:hypothetical protein
MFLLREECVDLGRTVLIPKTTDKKGWARLSESLRGDIAQTLVDSAQQVMKSRHAIEKEIQRLKAMGESVGRSQLIKDLRKRVVG